VGGHGQPGWSFADLLPVFRAIESDADFGGDWHGSGGPVPIRRPSADELSPLQRAFADAAVAAGHRLVGDHNEPGTVGAGPGPRNVRDGLRMSTTLTHLAAARGRPNPICTFSPPDRSTTPRARQAEYSASSPGCWRSAPGLGAPAFG